MTVEIISFHLRFNFSISYKNITILYILILGIPILFINKYLTAYYNKTRNVPCSDLSCTSVP